MMISRIKDRVNVNAEREVKERGPKKKILDRPLSKGDNNLVLTKCDELPKENSEGPKKIIVGLNV